LLYKEEIERFLRTRNCAGYQLLGLNDFSGQGTAIIGVVDAFWDAKPYVSGSEFKRFGGPVVPLALMSKRVWRNAETFSADIRVAQYSGTTIENAQPQWQILGSEGRTLGDGKLAPGDIPVGSSTEWGTVSFPLHSLATADQLILRVVMPGTEIQNEWSFWVYPETIREDVGTVCIANNIEKATDELMQGRSVLFLPTREAVAGRTHGVFEPVFWNRLWFRGQKRHTLGLLIDDTHPALKLFPADVHADWQWWDIMNNYKPMILDKLPPGFRPIVQPIDDWNTCRRLGMLLEANVGPGKLMVASCDLENDLDRRPVAAQLRKSLLAYMKSPEFRPKQTLRRTDLMSLFSGGLPNALVKRIRATSEHSRNGAQLAIDGDTSTLWHSEYKGNNKGSYPYELELELVETVTVSALNLLQRQDGNPNGMVKNIEILTSLDGTRWTSVKKAEVPGNFEWQSILFEATETRFIKLRILSPWEDGSIWASLAEIAPAVVQQ
jgi:hypothetical protein